MPPAEDDTDFESDSDDGAALSSFEDVLQGWAKAVQLSEWVGDARAPAVGGTDSEASQRLEQLSARPTVQVKGTPNFRSYPRRFLRVRQEPDCVISK